jgi:hypothetical protein
MIQQILIWLGVISLATLAISALLLPFVIWRLPEDYFVRDGALGPRSSRDVLLRALRNVLGGLFVLAGIAMLVLPGQGLLTILIGLMLMDFPRKMELERWFVTRFRLLRPLNWVRARGKRPPLRAP